MKKCTWVAAVIETTNDGRLEELRLARRPCRRRSNLNKNRLYFQTIIVFFIAIDLYPVKISSIKFHPPPPLNVALTSAMSVMRLPLGQIIWSTRERTRSQVNSGALKLFYKHQSCTNSIILKLYFQALVTIAYFSKWMLNLLDPRPWLV